MPITEGQPPATTTARIPEREINKSDDAKNLIRYRCPEPSKNALVAQAILLPGYHHVSLDRVPVTFDLPEGYAAVQGEGFEGGYGTTVSIVKEKAPGQFKFTGLSIGFYPYVLYRNNNGDSYETSPSDYVDLLYGRDKDDAYRPATCMTLFGNKAVRDTTSAAVSMDDDVIVTGYLKPEQLQWEENKEEYSVSVAYSTYGSGLEVNKILFDAVLNSLRLRQ